MEGAAGAEEDGNPRMVTTPWFDHEIPMVEAAELGTRRVIAEHSTVGVVVTTDGSIGDIPRASFVPAEERVVAELKAIGKPFVVVLNSAQPDAPETRNLAASLGEKYDVACLPVSCLTLGEEEVRSIIRSLLLEFPITELGIYLPDWVTALPAEHPVPTRICAALRKACAGMTRLRHAEAAVQRLGQSGAVSSALLREIRAGKGEVLA